MDFFESILDNMSRPLKDFCVYTTSCQYYVETLEDGMNELKGIRDDTKRRIDVEKRRRRRRMEPTNEVELWLKRVQKLEERAAKINQEYQECTAMGRKLRRIISTYRIGKKADQTLKQALNLKRKGYNFRKVANELVQVRFEEMPSTPVVGMASSLDQLCDSLANDEVGVVGIYGMGGVGKTAILSKFNNEILAVDAEIDLAIYIEVAKDFDMKEIQKVIGDRLGLSWDRKTSKERALILYKVLSEMNFVLLLDDLWEPLNLRKLGVPIPKRQSKSKIILATRIEDVCDQMDAKKKIKVECLPRDEAWELFQEKVGEAVVCSNSRIRRHAKEVADKCRGLPLALITVGRAMASKRTADEWKHAITVLKMAPWLLLGMETDVFNRLKRSYDNLSTDKLRTCLFYCSLFPEESTICKDRITAYCIGEGIIHNLYGHQIDEIYNMGNHLLGVLKTASLLERGDDEDYVKMHPMVRATVLWIAALEFGAKKTECIVQAGVGLKEAPRAEKWTEAETISLTHNDIHELYETPKSPHLRTLMLSKNPALEKICDGFFQFMPSLRVLDISNTSVSELPSEIGSLACLQYLDLCNTIIKSLPRELGSLVNLRSLLLSNTPIETIPSGVIGGLLALELLYMGQSYGDWKVGCSGTGVEFQELESLRRLRALSITIQTDAALQKLSQSHQLAGSTGYLHLEGCPGLVTIQLPSSHLWKNMTGLRVMRIDSCGDLEDVIVDGSSADDELQILANLENVTLQGLKKARIVWEGGCVEHLTYLNIWFCMGIEQLIETLSEEERKMITPFPNLKVLDLYSLPKFKRLSSGRTLLAFPSLEILKVVECPKLIALKLSAKKVTEIKGTKGWWDGLEWDDDDRMSTFLPLFKPL
ncbi:disease resistance protein RPS2-like [Typha angustifolia]|uniref:disease resistance protein RPS2-like n=1 Tax=Typha angustifolia TaxID=59011 RepID=UPI003C30B92E